MWWSTSADAKSLLCNGDWGSQPVTSYEQTGCDIQCSIRVAQLSAGICTSPSLPAKFQELAERITLRVAVADFYPVFRSDEFSPPPGHWFFDFPDRVAVDVAEFFGPIVRPLNRGGRVATVGLPSIRVRVEPLDHLEWFKRQGGHRCSVLQVVTEVLRVP